MSRDDELDEAIRRILPHNPRRIRHSNHLMQRLDEGGAEYMIVVWRERDIAVFGTPLAERLLGDEERIRARFRVLQMQLAQERVHDSDQEVDMPDTDIDG